MLYKALSADPVIVTVGLVRSLRTKRNDLELSDNPLATGVVVHLKVIESNRDVDQRKA